MNILETQALQGFIRLCNDGWLQGWHERNGGNLTYRMQTQEVALCKPFFNIPREWTDIGVNASILAGEHFITTGSGKFFRNVKSDPLHNIGIVEINSTGDAWRIVWGLENGAKPTSEFPTHFMNHAVRMQVSHGTNRVIYHAHTPYAIAMSFTLAPTARAVTRALWKSATECPVVFPDGVGYVPWMVPGGSDIALATSKVMQEHSAALWAHHGTFCAGDDFDTTFGLMHTIEKAAKIHCIVAANGGAKQSISDGNLKEVAKAFHVTLREEFLDD
ncbi:MAG: rhamnulose-1-phosphate aldolase [Eubacteriales bacterium]|nr:rhamnulose-1-phosphate aldolase [Eubacteriales bacterium]